MSVGKQGVSDRAWEAAVNICSQLGKHILPLLWELAEVGLALLDGQHQVLSTASTVQLWQMFQFSQQWNLISVICSLLSNLCSSHLRIFIYFGVFCLF